MLLSHIKDSTIQNDLKITLQMDSISVAATLLAKIAEERLFNFPINGTSQRTADRGMLKLSLILP